MKTLTDLKRTIKVGSRLRVVDHYQRDMIGQIRTVTKTQGNGYWFTIPSDTRRLWGDYPAKASLVTFPTPTSFRVTDPCTRWTGSGWEPDPTREPKFWELEVLAQQPAPEAEKE